MERKFEELPTDWLPPVYKAIFEVSPLDAYGKAFRDALTAATASDDDINAETKDLTEDEEYYLVWHFDKSTQRISRSYYDNEVRKLEADGHLTTAWQNVFKYVKSCLLTMPRCTRPISTPDQSAVLTSEEMFNVYAKVSGELDKARVCALLAHLAVYRCLYDDDHPVKTLLRGIACVFTRLGVYMHAVVRIVEAMRTEHGKDGGGGGSKKYRRLAEKLRGVEQRFSCMVDCVTNIEWIETDYAMLTKRMQLAARNVRPECTTHFVDCECDNCAARTAGYTMSAQAVMHYSRDDERKNAKIRNGHVEMFSATLNYFADTMTEWRDNFATPYDKSTYDLCKMSLSNLMDLCIASVVCERNPEDDAANSGATLQTFIMCVLSDDPDAPKSRAGELKAMLRTILLIASHRVMRYRAPELMALAFAVAVVLAFSTVSKNPPPDLPAKYSVFNALNDASLAVDALEDRFDPLPFGVLPLKIKGVRCIRVVAIACSLVSNTLAGLSCDMRTAANPHNFGVWAEDQCLFESSVMSDAIMFDLDRYIKVGCAQEKLDREPTLEVGDMREFTAIDEAAWMTVDVAVPVKDKVVESAFVRRLTDFFGEVECTAKFVLDNETPATDGGRKRLKELSQWIFSMRVLMQYQVVEGMQPFGWHDTDRMDGIPPTFLAYFQAWCMQIRVCGAILERIAAKATELSYWKHMSDVSPDIADSTDGKGRYIKYWIRRDDEEMDFAQPFLQTDLHRDNCRSNIRLIDLLIDGNANGIKMPETLDDAILDRIK
jgi:hypothetical protein